MKLHGTIVLNGANVAIEIELPDELLAPPVFLDDKGLRARWHSSARTLHRLRHGRQIAYTSPSPGRHLYLLEDVLRFEEQQRTAARPAVRVAARRAS